MRSSKSLGLFLTWKDRVMAMETTAMYIDNLRYERKAAVIQNKKWPHVSLSLIKNYKRQEGFMERGAYSLLSLAQ